MKKILSTLAVVMLCSASLFAQNPDKGYSFAVETGIGTEWMVGGRAQYNFNKYVAWDILNAAYALDYNKYYNFNEVTLTTGVRGYSPNFSGDLKAYGALDLGYGAMFRHGNTNCFALDFTAGIYVWQGLYAGYRLGVLANHGSHVDHMFSIGYNF